MYVVSNSSFKVFRVKSMKNTHPKNLLNVASFTSFHTRTKKLLTGCPGCVVHNLIYTIVVNLGFRTYGLVIFINKKDNKRDKD